jgi:carboxyl-terminal processing protease
VVVSRVVPGSPAAQRGVHSGWILERVGTLETARFVEERLAGSHGAGRALAQLHALLALQTRLEGAVGSQVRLGLRDARGRQVQILLPRHAMVAEVARFGHLPPQHVRFESERFTDAHGCIGVVRFNVWMAPVMPRLDDAMVAFRHCRGIIVDLRGNLGGVAAMVMGMGAYFVDSTTSLGTMHTRGGTLRYVASPRRSDRHGRPLAPFAGPLAILVDGHSVSTSEIFAAGLQVLGRARVFGEVTAGQALPSMLAPLPNGDLMQHVVADFTAPDGTRIEARGVIPDQAVPLRRSALLAGRDEPLQAAMTWLDHRALATPATAAAGRHTPR